MCRARTISRRHKTFPVFRSSASVISLSLSLAVRKTRSLVTTGEDRAKGTETFQVRFFVELNSVGNVKPSATPVPFGPRNCRHSLVGATAIGLAGFFNRWAYVDESAVTKKPIETSKSGSDFLTFILEDAWLGEIEHAGPFRQANFLLYADSR